MIASERQAINACLRSLSAEDDRFKPLADKYWVAHGGSYTDGGSFRFAISPLRSTPVGLPAKERLGVRGLTCTNKFGDTVGLQDRIHAPAQLEPAKASEVFRANWINAMTHAYDDGGAPTAWNYIRSQLVARDWNELGWGFDWIANFGSNDANEWRFARETLTMVRESTRRYWKQERASILTLVDHALSCLFEHTIPNNVSRITWNTRHELKSPLTSDAILVMDALSFPAEGGDAAARWMVRARQCGWRNLVVYNWRGGRFAAVGFGANTGDTRVHLYGDVGDYAGSGLDGAEVYLHADGQDQLGQIIKSGKFVIHGDVGQTFLYGAKGGEIYVLGSAAGRPLINAVGKPRAVINGTCLDYLAESFMAGDPHNGGGFVILNGVTYTEDGELVDLPSPYPGGNLFSLASGGAIFIRDPHRKVEDDQLNGGIFADLTEADWRLIEPYLVENERHFGIPVEALLTVDGIRKSPSEVYRKVTVYIKENVLTETENR